MELGIHTFVENTQHPEMKRTRSAKERVDHLLEEIRLADELGLDIFAVGEHHREEYVSSAPPILLAAAASVTKNIRLSSAVTVLGSDDPVRVFQQFATVDLISNGRAEIMAGRGSFIESFPLFGYDLQDYNELFDEKLELLMKINEAEKVTWQGKHRPSIDNLGVYARPEEGKLPIWIASGGTPQSAVRAGILGLPLVLAIIGGSPLQFAPIVRLYKQAAEQAGHDVSKLKIASHSHGFIAETTAEAKDQFYPSTAQ